MSGKTVREMTEDDIPELIEIEKACFPNPWNANMFRCQIRLADVSANLVHTEEGMINGYIIAWFGYEEMHILSIGVLPERRRNGIAGVLLSRAIGKSIGAGCRKAILEVRRSNEAAQKFYGKMGFRQIGVRKGYYRETGEDALVLEKEFE